MSRKNQTTSVNKTLNVNNFLATDTLKVPVYKNFTESGDNPGMEGNLIFNRSLDALFVHDGVSWRQVQDTGNNVTLTGISCEPSSAEVNLVYNSVGPDLEIRNLKAGAGISLNTDDVCVTITATAGETTTLESLACSPDGVSLVSNGVGPELSIKSLAPGTGVTIDEDDSCITINATAGETTTLESLACSPEGISLVSNGIGPELSIKSLAPGAGVTIDEDDSCITINATAGETTTLESLACSPEGISLVSNGVGPELSIKSLAPGAGVTIDEDESCITINATSGEITTLESLACSPEGISLVSNGIGPELSIKSILPGTGIDMVDDDGCVIISSYDSVGVWEKQVESVVSPAVNVDNVKLNVTTNGNLDDTENFLFGSSTINSDSTTTGGGAYKTTRMYFIGSSTDLVDQQGSIRAGTATGTQWDLENVGKNSVAFGIDNIASGDRSFVGGGSGNNASGIASVIAGGVSNLASGITSTVGGGALNLATGIRSVISGGVLNQLSGARSTIGGGFSNLANGLTSTISGGVENRTEGATSTISGGHQNRTDGKTSFIGGGTRNKAVGDRSLIVGGLQNTTSGETSTIGGGFQNTVSGDRSIIAGGLLNTISGLTSTIGGGHTNSISGNQSIIVGGKGNIVRGNNSIIVGGEANTILALRSFSFIGGGFNNTALSSTTTIGGGRNNKTAGSFAVICGGDTNSAAGQYSAIMNGSFNTIESGADYSCILGTTGETETQQYTTTMRRLRHTGGYIAPIRDVVLNVNITLNADDLYVYVRTGVSIQINLEASPAVGRVYHFRNNTPNNDIIVLDATPNTIDGAATFNLNSDASVTLVYHTFGWRVFFV